jgi:tetratricopeptide (TPR) repeat protein
VLVLPAAERLPDPTVLAHELAHLRRRDHWSAWFELVVQGLHFWNPLFWLARRNLHRAAELACDGWAVARFPAERRAFAGALVATAERASARFVPRAAQAIGSDARDFEERLVRILHADPSPRRWRGALAAAGLVAALSLPGLAAPTLGDFRRALPELPAGLDHEHWHEVLARAEGRLRVAPDDGAAEMQRGIALLGLGRAEESLAAFQRQHELGFRPDRALYNQACALVRLGDLEGAESCLAEAAELGLDVAALVAADPDLAALRAR